MVSQHAKKRFCYAVTVNLGLLCLSQPSLCAELDVHISGFKNDNGVVRVQLFNSEKTFTSKAESGFRHEIVPIAKGEAVVKFKDLPDGEYALRYMHDEKNSGKIPGLGFGGFPEMGFSNNAKFGFGMSKIFKEAKFNLTQDRKMDLQVGPGPNLLPLFGKK